MSNSSRMLLFLTSLSLAFLGIFAVSDASTCVSREDPADANRDTLQFSTLFLSRIVNTHLSNDEDIEKAIDWCHRNGLTKVYLETYRGNIWADKDIIAHARDSFRAAGFDVAGCVTTTKMSSTAMVMENGELKPDRYLACYSNEDNQEMLQDIFELTASLFDEIIIDDFYATVCECEACTRLKGENPWSKARCDLMLKMSRDRILGPAKKVNPNCRITIKFPTWIDHLVRAGYDVERSTPVFDAIFTGTETRDPAGIDSNPQYAAYFFMRMLNVAGEGKNLGGWFDYIRTSPEVYVEQARQTILAQAPEVMLFHYKALAGEEDPIKDMAALHDELPELFRLARLIKGKTPRGVLVPKPLDSSDLTLPETMITNDRYVFGFLGMLGIPLEPVHVLKGSTGPILATQHLLYDEVLRKEFLEGVDAGRPALMTSTLLGDLGGDSGKAEVIKYNSKLDLMTIPPDELNRLRNHALNPLGFQMDSPPRVSIHLYDEDLVVLENFNDEAVYVELAPLNGKPIHQVMTIPKSAETGCLLTGSSGYRITIAPRSLVVFSM